MRVTCLVRQQEQEGGCPTSQQCEKIESCNVEFFTYDAHGGVECEEDTACPCILLSLILDGTIGVAYSQQITVQGGGTAPYTFAVTSGTLPPGLSLSAEGLLSGTPTEGVDFHQFTITATDANECTGSMDYAMSVGCPPITVSPDTLPDATADAAYSETVSASGGTAPYSFAIVYGALPDGLSLSGAGDITGTPTIPGDYEFTVEAVDDKGCPKVRAYMLHIAADCGSMSSATLNELITYTTVCATTPGPFFFLSAGETQHMIDQVDLSAHFVYEEVWDGDCPLGWAGRSEVEHTAGPLVVGPYDRDVTLFAETDIYCDDILKVDGASICTVGERICRNSILKTLLAGETASFTCFDRSGAWCWAVGFIGVSEMECFDTEANCVGDTPAGWCEFGADMGSDPDCAAT
jgi:hypothetical protein